MALATPHLETVAGLAVGVTANGPSSDLTVRTSAAEPAHVTVAATPDHRSADRVTASYRRLVWQRIDIDGDRVECRLRGVRHRLPGERPISIGAALALVERGLPTIVRAEGH